MRDDVALRREPEARRRLFFLATSFAMRGMKPNNPYGRVGQSRTGRGRVRAPRPHHGP